MTIAESKTPQKQVPDLESRIIRYNELIPCRDAFIDTKTPGSDKKENFCLIGPGVAERPTQHVHLQIPHGFNIGGARQPNGCLNSQHSHETAEVFIVHRGQWAFRWGETGEDGEAVLSAGDIISIPTNVFRGFENVGPDDGFLFAVLGGDDPGFVTWAPYVFESAKEHGMVLLDDNSLIDTSAGEAIPKGRVPMQPTTREVVAAHRKMSLEDMLACVVFNDEVSKLTTTKLARASDGVCETPLIGPDHPDRQLPAGKMNWDHGFEVRRLDIAVAGKSAPQLCETDHVIFIQEGQIEISSLEGKSVLGRGDTMSVPLGISYQLCNIGDGSSTVFSINGTN